MKIILLVAGIDYLILGGIFGIVGFLILKRLKSDFLVFYNDHGNKIAFVSTGLLVSLGFRGLIDTLRFFVHMVNTSAEKYENVYNAFMLIFADLIPLAFQLSTLVFGYIRNRNEKKMFIETDRKSTSEVQDRSNKVSEGSYASINSSYFDPPLFHSPTGNHTHHTMSDKNSSVD